LGAGADPQLGAGVFDLGPLSQVQRELLLHQFDRAVVHLEVGDAGDALVKYGKLR